MGATPADQRGVPRLGTTDIGAVEFSGADVDGDGFDDIAAGGTDCDDTDPNIFPGAAEILYDGIDQDCDGSVLNDVDGDGFAAGQATGGTPDCDGTDPDTFPSAPEIVGDGIDQDCDGVDATEEQPGGADITFTLVGGFNAIVFTGPNGTPVQDIVDAVGPIMDSVFNFRASTQIWLVHHPDVSVPGLNAFVTVNQRDVLFIRLPANVTATVTLPNVLTAGPVGVVLEPGFTFVGYTGASDAALADLLAGLPPGVSAAFRFAAPVQEYEISRRGQALFLSTFTTANRFDGLFIFNQTVSDHALDWEQIGAAP